MMKIKFVDWCYGLLALLPLIIVSIVFPDYPDTIPVHFNSSGQVDRYGSKAELFTFPVVIFVIAILFNLLFHFINISTNKKNLKILNVLKIIIISVINIIAVAILLLTYNTVHSKAVPDIFKIGAILVCLGDIIIANYLPKCRLNGWVGIRTKWTLSSEEVWYKTHRFGGWMFAIGGIVLLVNSLLLKGIACLYEVTAGEMIMVTVIFFYSYKLSKKAGVKVD